MHETTSFLKELPLLLWSWGSLFSASFVVESGLSVFSLVFIGNVVNPAFLFSYHPSSVMCLMKNVSNCCCRFRAH